MILFVIKNNSLLNWPNIRRVLVEKPGQNWVGFYLISNKFYESQPGWSTKTRVFIIHLKIIASSLAGRPLNILDKRTMFSVPYSMNFELFFVCFYQFLCSILKQTWSNIDESVFHTFYLWIFKSWIYSRYIRFLSHDIWFII